MTYKPGQEVVVEAPSTPYAQQFKGQRGVIRNYIAGQRYAFGVELEGGRVLGFSASELAPADYVDVLEDISEALWADVTKPDEVNSPEHYTWMPNGVEVIDISELLNFNLGNVVKYTLRAGHKTESPATDLRKAAWYINREIQRLGAAE